MDTLTAPPDLHHGPPECHPWQQFDFDPEDAGGDPLTMVALELAARRHDLNDLFLAAHKLDEAALRVSEQLHDLEATFTDLQVEQAFNDTQTASY